MPLTSFAGRHHPRRGTGRVLRLLTVTALAATVLVPAVASAAPVPDTPSSTQIIATRVCTTPAPGHAACLAMLDTDATGAPLTPSEAAGENIQPYQAADLQSAYHLPSALLGARQTIAIVDAFDDPNAAVDLAAYRATNHLPACDADFPCFRKVNQRGGTEPPTADQDWAVEISLDLDMASAACPNCQLLLVEADDSDITNLAAAVDEAVALGADVVSNSYGATEYTGELTDLGSHYDHPDTTIVASSGDSGFGVQVPAAAPSVVAVGGTTLIPDTGTVRGWSETAWAGAGSGCSVVIAKPSWQKDKSCDKRSVTDVSAVADPHTPVAVFDTFGFPGRVAVGGTSVAAPLMAGVFALAGNATTISPGAYLAAHARDLNDVTEGSNGACGGSYLCTAVRGYDGPTGNGIPNGIGAF